MGEILLMPLKKKSIPEHNLQMLRAEQLSRFAGKVELAILRATETENFTKRLSESDTDELIEFFDAVVMVYGDHTYEIENLHKNRKEYQKLNSIYGRFILPEQRYIDNVLLITLREFDSELDNLMFDQFENANLIIKKINAGEYSSEWHSLYDFYQMLHMDNLAEIVARKMANLGDEYAKNIVEREGWTFSDLFDMIESYTQKSNVTDKKDNLKEKGKPSPDDFKNE